MVDLHSYKGLYIETAREILQQIDAAFQQKDFKELHRLTHSLKGQSLAMGYQNVGNLSLSLEKLYEALEMKKSALSKSQEKTLENTHKVLAKAIRQIEQQDKDPNTDKERGEIESIIIIL